MITLGTDYSNHVVIHKGEFFNITCLAMIGIASIAHGIASRAYRLGRETQRFEMERELKKKAKELKKKGS